MRSHGRMAAALVCAMLIGLAGTALAASPSWTTYHHDETRSGIDPDSTLPMTPAQAWQTPVLDGSIWGQPLVYGSDVYVATENDTVYALDAATGVVVWQRHVATPVPSGQLSCGDISPSVGITSTPVIDPGTGRIYVVADTWNGSSISHQMYGLNLSDGSVSAGPVSVEPPGDSPKDQLQRASLALDVGKIMIGYGGNDGDCGSYHGWLVAVPEGGGSLQTFEADSAHSEGAIWGSGNAPAIDSSGQVWISTGNGNSGSTFDYSESVIKLDTNLKLLDWWAPSNWSSLDSSDTDLGSTMPLLLPNGLVFEIGKAGVGYLLNASNLGHTGTSPLYQASVCSGSWGGGIYVNGVIYVSCSGGIHALALNAGAHTFAPVPGWSLNSYASGPPIYAGGLVWAASSSVGSDNGTLYGLDPSTGATRFSAALGAFKHFTTPSAGGGRLFVANGSKVTAFQIASAPGAAPTMPPAVTTAPTQTQPSAPVISHLRVRVVRRKLRISLNLSGGAKVTAVVARLVPGRGVHGQCRAAARRGRRGRRCTARLRRTTLHLSGRRGKNNFRPRMRPLPPARYLITITALSPAKTRSRPHTAVIVVRGA